MFLHKTPQPSSEPIDQSCIPHDLAIRLGSGNPGSSTQDPQKDLKLSPKHAKTSKNHPISPLRILPPTTPTDRLLPSVDPPLPVAHRSTRARPELDQNSTSLDHSSDPRGLAEAPGHRREPKLPQLPAPRPVSILQGGAKRTDVGRQRQGGVDPFETFRRAARRGRPFACLEVVKFGVRPYTVGTFWRGFYSPQFHGREGGSSHVRSWSGLFVQKNVSNGQIVKRR